MKKVTVAKVREEAKYFCDKHPDRECYSEVQTSAWYGSGFDLMTVKVNMCDECLTAFYKYIKENFGLEPYEDEGVLLGRCSCSEERTIVKVPSSIQGDGKPITPSEEPGYYGGCCGGNCGCTDTY